MMRDRPLRVVELTTGPAGALCGRLFAGLGNDVIRCEREGDDPTRDRPPLADGLSLGFIARNAGKASARLPRTADLTAPLSRLLDSADVLVLDLLPSEAGPAGLTDSWLRERWPELVVVWITAFARDSAFADVAGDSLLAECYGGLATMIGEPDRRPLALGGEQMAYCGAATALFGAMIALRRRDQGHGGDLVDVVLADVAAYADWKSDLVHAMTGRVPRRAGLGGQEWKLIRAREGWVGAIFQQNHWPAMVELIDDPVLRDPELADEVVRNRRASEWWPVVDRWAADKTAEEIYRRAQALGLPFGWAMRVSDLVASEQLRERGFLDLGDPARRPVVGAPVRSEQLPWRTGPAPSPGEGEKGWRTGAPRGPVAPREAGHELPLEGLVVLDFGTITAGAAVTRLLADHGATVLKIETRSRPDTFRSWKAAGTDRPTESPYFPSNNAGKLGVSIDLKTEAGRRLVHRIAARSHVVVENFRVGVTERLGIDAATLKGINPDLVYLSLSSQGQTGPEARNISFGSTLDLLSGLASVTGYEPGAPMWSSSEVNYPDQLVSLVGAAIAVYCVVMGDTGVHLDASQREVVAWTLGTEIADYLVNGVDSRISGNRRPGRTPHDTYPAGGADDWIAISCRTDAERAALAGSIGAEGLAGRDERWWREHADEVDELVGAWSRRRGRDDAVAALVAAGVPAVPVLTAEDRARRREFAERAVSLRGADGFPVKGVPVRFRDYRGPLNVAAPALGADTRRVLREVCGLTDDEIAALQEEGAVFCAPETGRPTDRPRAATPQSEASRR